MRLLPLVLAALVLSPLPGAAQTPRPPESVTVTGTGSRQVLENFVQSLAAPTRLTGKLARWQAGICPVVLGLRPQAIAFIGKRLKEIAAEAGAPVDARSGCKPNLEIVFTTAPQGLMDWVRQKHPDFLGYHDNSGQADRLATVTHPIQAWYVTATRDVNGYTKIDSSRTVGMGDEDELRMALDFGKPDVTGSRLGDGRSSSFYHVIIAVDPGKLMQYEMGSLSDYIAMLALTQISSLDTCQQLPSIVNMLAKDCARKANALSENDLAYLKGLYRMSADQNVAIQRGQVAYQMERELKGR